MKSKSWYLLRTKLSQKLLAHKSAGRATLNHRIAVANANKSLWLWARKPNYTGYNMKKPSEHEYTSHVAYSRELEVYCAVVEAERNELNVNIDAVQFAIVKIAADRDAALALLNRAAAAMDKGYMGRNHTEYSLVLGRIKSLIGEIWHQPGNSRNRSAAF